MQFPNINNNIIIISETVIPIVILGRTKRKQRIKWDYSPN
jgi:hypothetical protein